MSTSAFFSRVNLIVKKNFQSSSITIFTISTPLLWIFQMESEFGQEDFKLLFQTIIKLEDQLPTFT